MFNQNDVLGIGVAVGYSGMSVLSGSSSSSVNMRDAATRRKSMAKVIERLKSHRHSHTYDQLLQAVEMDEINQDARNEFFKDIKVNPKISAVDADHVAYKPTHSGLANLNELGQYLQRFTHGLPQDELEDAYDGVSHDINLLLASGQIYYIDHIEKKKKILFPHIEEYKMRVDQDLKEMWAQVQMPKTQVDLEERLHVAGHLSDTQYRAGHLEKSRLMQAQIKLAAGQKLISQDERRAKRKRYPIKVTNSHLYGQYNWFQAPSSKPGAPSPAPNSGTAAAAAAAATANK